MLGLEMARNHSFQPDVRDHRLNEEVVSWWFMSALLSHPPLPTWLEGSTPYGTVGELRGEATSSHCVVEGFNSFA